jgi:hypothetical protein
MAPHSRETLDEQLSEVLMALNTEAFAEEFASNLSFRISPWLTNSLAFDLPLAEPAHASLQGGGDSLPLRAEVEPVVEFLADDLASRTSAAAASRACTVTIEKVTHSVREFSAGAGMIGEAMIRVKLMPLGEENDKKLQVWRSENTEVDSLCIKEARA